MRVSSFVILASLGALGVAASAAAQDHPSVGVTMGYPASIGVIWHLSDRLAIRPEVSLQQISTTSTSVITSVVGFVGGNVTTTTTTTQSTNDQWNTAVGASGLFYLQQWDALRTYVSPRFLYSRVTSSSTTSTAFSNNEFTSNAYFVSGSVGADYTLSRRFGVYGEVGFGYTHQSTTNSFAPAGSNTGHTIATRSGVGAILYF
jgi:hypothetical protein